MKQFKHKKFIGLALLVFLVFMVLGKYTQSTAFTSSSRVYATTVLTRRQGIRYVLKSQGQGGQIRSQKYGDWGYLPG
ncbi:MAG: hypothetical protein ACLSDG_08715 [Streptococcus thermophilus]